MIWASLYRRKSASLGELFDNMYEFCCIYTIICV
jgi:hypothetical protein